MGIEVVREYHAVGEGILEVSRLSSILVNLIRNGINSMREVAERVHRLILACFALSRSGRVRSFANRRYWSRHFVGLPDSCFLPQQPGHQSDLLPNLHASALAAKDLGGSLRVWSDGPNQGAIFTLDLPVIHMEEIQ